MSRLSDIPRHVTTERTADGALRPLYPAARDDDNAVYAVMEVYSNGDVIPCGYFATEEDAATAAIPCTRSAVERDMATRLAHPDYDPKTKKVPGEYFGTKDLEDGIKRATSKEYGPADTLGQYMLIARHLRPFWQDSAPYPREVRPLHVFGGKPEAGTYALHVVSQSLWSAQGIEGEGRWLFGNAADAETFAKEQIRAHITAVAEADPVLKDTLLSVATTLLDRPLADHLEEVAKIPSSPARYEHQFEVTYADLK